MKALIIDGGQAVRSMMGYALDSEGFEVRQASGPLEVRGLLGKGFVPDVVITCQSNAGIDVMGLRLLKAHSAMKKVPVILMAEKEDLERQMKWKEAGVTCWLTWPVTPAQFLEMVQIVLFDSPKKKKGRGL
jgi:DNA-binding response OmpR family regulator